MSLTYADDKAVRGAELIELYREAGWSLLERRDPKRVEASIRGSERFFTARDGSKLAGFIMALSDGALYVHVSEFLVRQGYRDKGVERELLRRLLESVPEAELVTLFGDPADELVLREHGFTAYAGGLMRRQGR